MEILPRVKETWQCTLRLLLIGQGEGESDTSEVVEDVLPVVHRDSNDTDADIRYRQQDSQPPILKKETTKPSSRFLGNFFNRPGDRRYELWNILIEDTGLLTYFITLGLLAPKQLLSMAQSIVHSLSLPLCGCV